MRFDTDLLEFDEPVEVKMYRDGGWRWEPGTVVDPTATPVVVEMADGRHVTPKGGRVRRARRNR